MTYVNNLNPTKSKHLNSVYLLCILKVYTISFPAILCMAVFIIKMADIFDNTILCKKCGIRMKKEEIEKNGFLLRAVKCSKCNSRVLHPSDEAEYNKFTQLRNKTFRVKMRIVGNSYAVSIPREIVNFIKEQEKIMNDMVRLCFNDSKKLSLMFGEELEDDLEE